MAANSGVFLGGASPIRGIPAGGLPWMITDCIKGELESDGELKISVRSLVLADQPAVPANLRLTNPVSGFIGIVSCLGSDGLAQNVTTGAFPADAQGNAKIKAVLNLPSPCIAPIIFVASPNGAWFAATGR